MEHRPFTIELCELFSLVTGWDSVDFFLNLFAWYMILFNALKVNKGHKCLTFCCLKHEVGFYV